MYGPMTVPTKYRTQDIRWLKKIFRPGRVLEVKRLRSDGEEMVHSTRAEKEIVTVVDTFPHIVSCVDENGFRRTFSYFELDKSAKIIR